MFAEFTNDTFTASAVRPKARPGLNKLMRA